jgi:hypothetical protein
MHYQSGIHKHTDDLDIIQKLNKHLTYLLSVNVLTFILGIFAYGDKYLLREYAFSYLGGIHTINGNPNTTSLLIFAIGMISCGIICFYISQLLNGENGLEMEKTKHYLFQTSGIGYFIMLMPHDINNNIHAIGAATVFGTLWFITVLILRELKQKGEVLKFYIYHFMLQGTVIPYAFLYFVNSPLQQYIQKYAVFGLILVMKLALIESVKIYQKRKEEISQYQIETPENMSSGDRTLQPE